MLENDRLEAQERLRALFVRLSEEVVSSDWAPSIGGQITGRLMERKTQLHAMLENKEESDEAERKTSALRREYDEESAGADEASRALTEQYKILGAILFEQKSSGTLDEKITIMDADWDEISSIRNDMESGIFKRMLRRVDKAHFERTSDERYYRYGVEIFDEGQDGLIKGAGATKAKNDIEELRKKLAHSVSEMERIRKELSLYEGPGKGKLDEEIEEAERDIWALSANNGQYLYENGQKWLDENTPSQVLDCISEILDAEKALHAIDERIKGLSDEAEKAEIRLLIEEDRKRVRDLEKEKKMIDEKILSLEKEIERMEEIIGEEI